MWVVIALYDGLVSEVRASDDEDIALGWRDELDREYGIERRPDGCYESFTHDVVMYRADVVRLAGISL
jgi:hypothetical protein